MVKSCIFLVSKRANKDLMAKLEETIGADKTIKPIKGSVFFTKNHPLNRLVETMKFVVTVCAVESHIKPEAIKLAVSTAIKNKVPFLIAKKDAAGRWIIEKAAPGRELATN